MKFFRRGFFSSLSFAIVFLSLGLQTRNANADIRDEILSQKTLEFMVTQEVLFQNFVEFTLNRYCSSQLQVALSRIRSENPMDTLVTKLCNRESKFLHVFRGCPRFNHVLNLLDEFTLKVPQFFNDETLPLATLILLDPTRDDSLEERIPVVEARIQKDIENDYTPEKLLPRLERLSQTHRDGIE